MLKKMAISQKSFFFVNEIKFNSIFFNIVSFSNNLLRHKEALSHSNAVFLAFYYLFFEFFFVFCFRVFIVFFCLVYFFFVFCFRVFIVFFVLFMFFFVVFIYCFFFKTSLFSIRLQPISFPFQQVFCF